jgi:hypothetical protein
MVSLAALHFAMGAFYLARKRKRGTFVATWGYQFALGSMFSIAALLLLLR